MIKSKITFFIFSMLVLGTFQTNAQNFLSTNGKAIVNENQDTILLRGMGLGGWMVQEGYMLQTAGFANPQHEIKAIIQELIGEADTQLFYDAWLANHARKADIDSLKSWGFNSVRLPMHYNLYTLPIEEEPIPGEQTWLTKGFELTDSLISWCAQNEMYVILDLHAAPGGQGYDAAISDYDPTKPSLWESEDNRDKMVALWQRLAARYVDEQWVAGYDLLNEVNWDLPGGVALKNLYKEATDSIRTVDTEHIIFIEGNWFANDFTGLTPPWDDNLVYSPHKYWSVNDQASIQWVLDLRNTYDVPLYLGETGENSNVWFRDAVRLYEDNTMGWAWWPMKKVEAVAGPLSITKNDGYQTLLDYWSNGGTTPTANFAKTALMQLAEDLKVENCRYQKDVIDALFRQVYSDETIPYATNNIPGLVYAPDYDMGVVGEAYQDSDLANYSVTTGEYSAWNNGWAYRNDGVDIETCSDDVNSNGFNVGFLEADEWMSYSVNVASGIYDIHVRVASGGSGGRFHFAAGDANITPTTFASPTGGWQDWQTVIVPNVILDATDSKLKFYVDQAGFNVSSFEFIETDVDIASIPTQFVAAITVDEYNIQMNANKFLEGPLPTAPGDFEIFVNGNSIPITDLAIDTNNPRIINFTVDYILKSTEVIKISYNGNQVMATDETLLNNFTLEDVQNTLKFVHQIPGRIESEDFDFQEGVSLETTTDVGGGENIAFLDPGDYLDYEVNVTSSGIYTIDYRTAAQFGTGGLEVQLIDAAGNINVISSPTFASTGDWQNWETTTENVQVPVGRYLLRVLITQSPFNMNWLDFSLTTATKNPSIDAFSEVKIFPNPSNGLFNVQVKMSEKQNVQMEIFNINGAIIDAKSFTKITEIEALVSLNRFPAGFYFLVLRLEDGTSHSSKLVKLGE
ncbi:MAG: endoglucanase [Saprospiraceae bacterium]|jgi:endoglucanase